jgi:hypothetical protein
MEAGRFATGCDALAESQRLEPRPGTLFTLAACRARAGQAATADALFDEYVRWCDRLPPAQRAAQRERLAFVRKSRAELAGRIAHLTLRLPPDAPAQTAVRRDGVALGPDALATPLPVDPGEHVIVTEAPGGAPTEHRVDLAPGEARDVRLGVAPRATPLAPPPAPPPRAAPVRPPPARTDWQRPVAYGAAALGALGLVTGSAAGALALGQRAEVDRHCDGTRCRDRAGLDAVDRGRTFSAASTAGFVVGGAGLVAAALFWLSAPARPTAAALAPDVTLPLGAATTPFAGLRGVW